jgi:hypothetical protein
MNQSYKKMLSHVVGLCLIVTGLQVLTGSCARIMPLEGGPMDTTPPQLISSFPLHESVGFKGKEIRLEFDKEIEVQDLYNRLVVAPKLAVLEGEPSYVYTARGKTLWLKLKVPLQEETTYTFNFKDAIKDTKEGTPAMNPVLTFGTGDHLDAMYITGMVKHLMTDQPASNALVSLYRSIEDGDADTLNILNSSPDYFTKADEKGYFKLDHIKEGKYRIYAGQSQENKLTIDLHTEPYGFLPVPIEVYKPVEGIGLNIVQADIAPLTLQTKQPQGPWFELGFSKPIAKYKLELVHQLKRFKEKKLYSHLVGKKGETIRVYNIWGLLEEDSLEALLQAEDAMGNVIEDTVSINFRENKIHREPFAYALKPVSNTKIDSYYFEGHITFNKPIKKLQTTNIFFVVNEKDTIHVDERDIDVQEHQDAITIKKKFKPWELKSAQIDNPDAVQSNLILQVNKDTFLSVEQEANAPGSYRYSLKTPQECGTIRGRIKTQAPGFIIQLLNEKYEVVKEIRNQTDYVFKDLLPGDYRIRVLGLRGQNAAWSFGNIHQSKPPDPVVFYPYELPIVPNWEFDYIDISF